MSLRRQQIKETGLAGYEIILGQAPKKMGAEHYFFCPLHEDSNRSLRVGSGSGTWLWYCDPCQRGGDIVELYRRMNNYHPRLDYPKTLAELEEKLGTGGAKVPEKKPPKLKPGTPIPWEKRSDIEEIYTYTDEKGNVLYQKAKIKSGSSRTYRFRCKKGDDWDYSGAGDRHVPYGLRALAKASPWDIVVICEGEKDADALHERGVVAVTGGGAGQWKEEWSGLFIGHRVLVIGDHDEPGYRGALKIAKSVSQFADETRVLKDWTYLADEEPTKGFDVSDWLYSVPKEKDQAAIVHVLWDASDLVDPDDAIAEEIEELGAGLETGDSIIEGASGELAYVLSPVLPTAGLSLLASQPGGGKSTLARNLAVNVAKGEPFLGLETAQGPVVLVHLEEDKKAIRRHIVALGYEASMPVYILDLERQDRALEALCRVVRKMKPALVVIDPMQEFLQIREINAYSECYDKLHPLRELARSTGSHIMLLHHSDKADQWFLGSQGIRGSVDSLLLLKGTRTQHRILSCDKIRYGSYIEDIAMDFDPEKQAVSYLCSGEEALALDHCDKIVKVIEAEGRPLSKAELLQATGLSGKDVWRAVNLDPKDRIIRIGGRTRVRYTTSAVGSDEPDQPIREKIEDAYLDCDDDGEQKEMVL